jgi:transcriptional regulator with XRE-family HTH domain
VNNVTGTQFKKLRESHQVPISTLSEKTNIPQERIAEFELGQASLRAGTLSILTTAIFLHSTGARFVTIPSAVTAH